MQLFIPSETKDQLTNTLLSKKSEQFRINIRKEELNSNLQTKRIKYLEKKNCSKEQEEDQSEEEKIDETEFLEEFAKVYEDFNNFSEQKVKKYLKKIQHFLSNSDPCSLISKIQLLLSNPKRVQNLQEFSSIKFNSYRDIQFQAICICCQLSYVMNLSLFYENNWIENIVEVVKSSDDEELNENIIWLLSNLSGDKQEYKNKIIVLGANGLFKILVSRVYQFEQNSSICESICRFCSNITHSRPQIALKFVSCFILLSIYFQKLIDLFTLCFKLSNSSNIQVIYYILDFFKNITMSSTEGQKVVATLISTDLFKKFNNFIKSSKLKLPTLQLLSNLTVSDDSQNLYLIQNGVLDLLIQQLDDDSQKIRQQTAFALSNLASGDQDCVEYFVNNKILLNKLQFLINNDSYLISNECIICLTNLTYQCNREQFLILFNENILDLFIEQLKLKNNNNSLTYELLDAIKQFAYEGNEIFDKQQNIFVQQIEKINGIEIIQELCNHQEEKISDLAQLILEQLGK